MPSDVGQMTIQHWKAILWVNVKYRQEYTKTNSKKRVQVACTQEVQDRKWHQLDKS